MRRFFAVLLAVGLCVPVAAKPPAWPGGRELAVVLTYDDALSSQLDIAIPQLDAAGLKGTFFLVGSALRPEDIGRWRAAAAEGHELGNHTLFHPCARGRYDMPPQYNAESYSVVTMLAEIRTMNTMLTAIDGKPQHPFAMPCGDTQAGGQDYVEPLRTSGLTRYARGVTQLASVDPGHFDAFAVPSLWFQENVTGAELIDAVKRAEPSGGFIVLGFHGVGGNHLSVPAAAHAELVAYLKAHESTIWVAPFSEVLDYATGK